jgi:hypothetical protein
VSWKGTEDFDMLKEPLTAHVPEIDLLLYHSCRFADKKLFKSEKKESSKDDLGEKPQDNVNKTEKKEPKNDFLDKFNPVEFQDHFIEVIDFLLSNGANPNAPIINGITPFMVACTINNREVIDKMVNNEYYYDDIAKIKRVYHKADLSKNDGGGNNAFYYACLAGSFDVMEYLVESYGLDINRQNFLDSNRTMLHLMCLNLPDYPNFDPDGFSFGLYGKDAIEYNDKIIDKLISMRADPTIMDAYDNLPEELVPAPDPNIDKNFTAEEVVSLDNIFQKVGEYRKEFISQPATVIVKKRI